MMYLGDPYRTDAGLQIYRVGTEVSEPRSLVIDRPQGSGDHVFIHFTSGATVRLGGEKQHVKPGGCILYTPTCPQWYTGGRAAMLHDWFHFVGPDQYTHVKRFGPATDRVFYSTQNSFITDTIRQLYWEITLKAECWEHAMESLVRNLLVVLRREEHGLARPSSAVEERLRRIRIEIQNEPERDWNVSRMAQQASLSRSRFSVLFKRFFGSTPHAEVLHLRLHRARRLLNSTTWSVDQIAREAGFRDPAYFNRIFKKYMGVTPGKYRG